MPMPFVRAASQIYRGHRRIIDHFRTALRITLGPVGTLHAVVQLAREPWA
jgi:hypothetical protein